jgi:hypothetical protein
MSASKMGDETTDRHRRRQKLGPETIEGGMLGHVYILPQSISLPPDGAAQPPCCSRPSLMR